MKEMKLKIQINRPVTEVFTFCINPDNTPNWVESIVVEETNEWPVRLGTIYKNQRKNGESNEMVVTAFDENKIFFLKQNSNNLEVKYTFTQITPDQTELIYELVYEGDLEESVIQKLLDNLKRVMESE
jgi:uncharacterized protein YndB with AHSA1/START domain